MTKFAKIGMLVTVVGLMCLSSTVFANPNDGSWTGKRLSKSNTSGGVTCNTTNMKLFISNSKIKSTLTYNGARLSGTIGGDNKVKFSGGIGKWSYTFTGNISGKTMKGDWKERRSGCGGTWSVRKN